MAWLMTSRHCTILFTIAVLKLLVGCSSGNKFLVSGRRQKKHGASFTIGEARVEAFRLRFTFLSMELHERDPLRFVVAGIPGFTFTSRAMAMSLITPNRVKNLVDQVPYEDFALV